MVTNEAQGIFTGGMQVVMLFFGNFLDNNKRQMMSFQTYKKECYFVLKICEWMHP